MIRSIRIKNVALIEDMFVSFHQGLQVLSGETGAGKSIILDAVTLILGGRADKNLIRTGCDKAVVEAEFESGFPGTVSVRMESESIDWDGQHLTVYREIGQNGRNICRVNGVPVPVSTLRDIVSEFLNLYGQSEYQYLADSKKHLGELDLLGDSAHQELRKKTEEAYRQFIQNHREYAKIKKQNEGKELRLEILERELKELRQTAVTAGEEERLKEECARLGKAARIHEKIQYAHRKLVSGENGDTIMTDLQSAGKGLRSLEQEDEEFGALADQCDHLYYQMEDIAYRLNQLKDRYDFDPDRLDSIENRLDSIRRLERKYGPSEEDVMKAAAEKEEEYRILSNMDSLVEKKGAEHKKLLAAYRSAAKALTNSRRALADIFQRRMTEELHELDMKHTVFQVAFYEPVHDKPVMPTADGDDQVEFMISPNPGEPLKPLAKIASGGELSRIMLAIKTVECGSSGIETMIYDEIDTGISGHAAQAVAEKLSYIAGKQQVICVSHLPQIAAAADYQYLVHKEIRDGRTVTEVTEMDEKTRISEVARMISGAEGISPETQHYADTMIQAARRKKKATIQD